MKIVLVDDHEMVLTSLAAQLEKLLHADVWTCTNSKTLLRLLSRSKMDIVFLDIHLREENGLDILPAIKKAHPNITVVLLSAAASYHTILQAQQLGAQGFIAKDDGVDALLKAANELPSGSFYLSHTAMRAFHPG
jgi:DNA-binding NarL/FixJ family response regulator